MEIIFGRVVECFTCRLAGSAAGPKRGIPIPRNRKGAGEKRLRTVHVIWVDMHIRRRESYMSREEAN